MALSRPMSGRYAWAVGSSDSPHSHLPQEPPEMRPLMSSSSLLPQCLGKCHTHQQHLVSADSSFSSNEKMQGLLRKVTKANQSNTNYKERRRKSGLTFSEENEKSHGEVDGKVLAKTQPKVLLLHGASSNEQGLWNNKNLETGNDELSF